LANVRIDFSFEDDGSTPPSSTEIEEALQDANEEVNASLEAVGVDGSAFPSASVAPTPTPSGSRSIKKGKKNVKKGKARKKAKSAKEGKSIKKRKYYKNEKNSKRV